MASNLLHQIALLLPITLLLFANICCTKPLCENDERSALLQFKQSFVIDTLYASGDPSSYPKVESWNSSNCCVWVGVECDEISGHVIGLDLSSSCLYGSLNSNSSLFHLTHLQSLNLGDNNFSFSLIPPKIASLSNLTYLDLSYSVFSGQIPMEISNMSDLASLDLRGNYLSLENFKRLVRNLTRLETLDLSGVNISSSLPDDVFMNLHSLASLRLLDCNLIGAMPYSLGELTKLAYLHVPSNSLSGDLSSLLENLTDLIELDLSFNNFAMGGLSWLGKQTKLKYLRLLNMNLVGEIPSCLKNLTNLQDLRLGKNKLRGHIPAWLSNLTQLSFLELGPNELSGPIPESISQLASLQHLNLQYNDLSGTIRFEMFMKMKDLTYLHINGNNLTLLTSLDANYSFSKFEHLGLANCNLRKVPNFIRHQNGLTYLDLYANNFEGHVPSWIGNVGNEALNFLDLSYNSFSGFEQPSSFLLLKNLAYLDLSFNKLQAPLPLPPLSIEQYVVSSNYFTGEISPWFCKLRSLTYFIASNNNLHGIIPQCLLNCIDTLIILSLANNHLNGIPDTFKIGNKLRMIDVSHNQLVGNLPRTLSNCEMLEFLDVSENQIHDNFPMWLGSLPMLEVMILRYNHFFGSLKNANVACPFPKLRILDLSHNEFAGIIPSGFFQSFNNMMALYLGAEAYMQVSLESTGTSDSLTIDCTYQIIVANKGIYLKYWKIPEVLAAIDVSSNKFMGGIPDSLATLKMINVLNLSKNHFSGHIPLFLRNLTNLESLDLSFNNFSGKIPQQLVELTFLEYFNVSNNQFIGSIPQGQQFDTFDNTSYLGNSELCGPPLTRNCKKLLPSAQPRIEGSKLPLDVSWKSVAIGYGSGIVVGIFSGLVFYKRHQTWLLYIFERWHNKRARRLSRRGRGRHVVYQLRRVDNHWELSSRCSSE